MRIYGLMLIGLLSFTASASNQLIEGFAKWQADRIERIAVDQALEDIAENIYVKKYFFETSNSIQFYDSISGQRLIPLLQINFQQDLDSFDNVTLCLKYQLNKLIQTPSSDNIEAVSKLIDGLQKLIKSNQSNLFTTHSFIDKYCKNVSEQDLNDSRFILTEVKKVSAVRMPDQNKSAIAQQRLNQALMTVVQKDTDFGSDFEKTKSKIMHFATRIVKLIEDIEQSIKIIEDDSVDVSYVQKAHHMLLILDLVGTASEELFNFEGFSVAKLNRLKSISLFLAGLADASKSEQGADQVVAILNQFVDEQDTYNKKRHNTAYLGFTQKYDLSKNTGEKINYTTSCRRAAVLPCRDSLFLTSYYGLSIMQLDEQSNNDREWTGRAYGPVGVELKLMNYRGSPITLGYAPIDIGNYITAELKGDSYDAKTEDILSPSVFVSWSAASRPFSILVGYQKDIKIDNSLTENSAFIAFAFDLPIATIY